MKLTNHQKLKSARGFTLVELLVVIAIIATLAALVTVGVRGLYGKAAATKTSKNMKSIWNSMQSLGEEGVNTGLHARSTFPPYAGSLQSGNQPDFIWWDLVAENLDLASREGSEFVWVEPFSETLLQNPLSEKVLGEGKTDWTSLLGDVKISRGGYAYNANLGGDVSSEANQEDSYIVQISKCKEPASTIYFGESDDEGKTAGWVFSDTSDAPQGNRKDRAHCCFVDGHVEAIENFLLKDASTFEFYTSVEEKDFSKQPSN